MRIRPLFFIITCAFFITCSCGAADPDIETPTAGTPVQTTATSGTAAQTTTAGTSAPVTATTAKTAVTTTAGAPEELPDPFKKYDPPIEMPVAYSISAQLRFPDGDGVDDNAWSRYLEDNAGIKLKVLWTDDGNADTYRNKLYISMAAGEVPAVYEGDYQLFNTGVKEGYAADLTDIWADWASDRVKRQAEGFDLYFKAATADGKLMAVPKLAYIEQQGNMLWIRSDWLDAAGLNAPETFEDVIGIARAFTADDPDGDGEPNTYGVGLRRDIFNYDFFNVNGIMSAFGAPVRNNEMFFRDETSGKIAYAGIMPEAKNALKAINALYNEGAIDPEFTEKSESAAINDINGSKVGMAYGAEWNGWNPYASIYADEGVVYKPYAPPAAENARLRIGASFPVSGYNIFNSKYEHPEAVMVIRNFADELINEDTPNEIRALYNDAEMWRMMPWRFQAPAELTMQRYFDAAYENNNDESLVPNEYKSVFRQIMSYIEDGEAIGQGVWTQRGPEGSLSIIRNKLKPAGVYYPSPILGARPDSLTRDMPLLNTLIEEAYTAIITGPADGVEAGFETFVGDWLKSGGRQILEDLNAMYPE